MRLGFFTDGRQVADALYQGSYAGTVSVEHEYPVLERTVMDLAAGGLLDVGALVSHVVPVGAAADAFAMLDFHPDDAVQVLLDFREL